jgi:hypothetical protein
MRARDGHDGHDDGQVDVLHMGRTVELGER